jgi:hypothetical protein
MIPVRNDRHQFSARYDYGSFKCHTCLGRRGGEFDGQRAVRFFAAYWLNDRFPFAFLDANTGKVIIPSQRPKHVAAESRFSRSTIMFDPLS